MEKHDDILKLVAKNDQHAFGQLYELYADKVYNTAISYMQNERDAEEVTQDIFVSIFRNAKSFKRNSSVSTWIYRISVNTSINYLRKRKKYRLFQFGTTPNEKVDFVHPGVLLENKENAKALFKVIETLPESQKTAFILSFVEDLPRKKVAEIMETSLKSVESLLQRAKKSLRKKLKESNYLENY
ncbi:MAG: RNA polymerase sigma factor [Saprospiraceae bacterium]